MALRPSSRVAARIVLFIGCALSIGCASSPTWLASGEIRTEIVSGYEGNFMTTTVLAHLATPAGPEVVKLYKWRPEREADGGATGVKHVIGYRAVHFAWHVHESPVIYTVPERPAPKSMTTSIHYARYDGRHVHHVELGSLHHVGRTPPPTFGPWTGGLGEHGATFSAPTIERHGDTLIVAASVRSYAFTSYAKPLIAMRWTSRDGGRTWQRREVYGPSSLDLQMPEPTPPSERRR